MPKLYTIGHSTHTLKEFLAMLEANNITHLVDVRSIPKSKFVPWFNEEKLKKVLQQVEISYTHMSVLGGLRKTQRDSINQAWRNSSFRGYADYMQTPEFFAGLKTLNQLIKQNHRVVIMCAEALPWRCHRSLIADAEVIRGITVLDIMSPISIHPHKLTSFAVVDRTKRPIKIYYPK